MGLTISKLFQFVFMGHDQIDSALESFQEEVKVNNFPFSFFLFFLKKMKYNL